MNLDNLKYSELQMLAKGIGIKANMKIEKLIKALNDYYRRKECDSHSSFSSDGISTSQSEPSSGKEDENLAAREVRKENVTKRKMSGRDRNEKTSKRPRADKKNNVLTGETQDKIPESEAEVNYIYHTNKLSKKPLKRTHVDKPTLPSKGTPRISRSVWNKAACIEKSAAKSSPAETPKVKKLPAIQSGFGSTPHSEIKKAHDAKTASAKSTPDFFSPLVAKTLRRSLPLPDPGDVGSASKSAHTDTAEEGNSSLTGRPPTRHSPRSHANLDKINDIETKSQVPQPDPAEKPSGKKRQRKNTFDLEESTLGAPATPEVTVTNAKTSPGMQVLLDSMTGEMSSAERQKRLLSAIEKKVEGKVTDPCPGPGSQIPTFAAYLAKKKQEQKRPVTPGNKDWEKVHQREFSKFDSIDVYLEKKRKRAEEMTASVKKVRTVLHEVQEAVTKLKSKRTPSLGKKTPVQTFRPSVISTKNMNLNFGITTRKTPNNRKSTSAVVAFKPTVISTKNMNLNFSAIKTPVNEKIESKRYKNTLQVRKSNGTSQAVTRKPHDISSATKYSSTTPFHFTGNMNVSEARSTSKPVFDLKASLARPVTWKPHTGKLKPLDTLYTSHIKDVESSASKFHSRRMDIFKSAVNKNCRTYSRQDRRAAVTARRAEKKTNLHMKRRDITGVP